MSDRAVARFKGGPGSGHRGHAGRPGKRGGSVPGTGGAASAEEAPVAPRKGGMTANTSSTSLIDRKGETVLNDRANEYCGRDDVDWDNCEYPDRGKIKDGLVTELAERSGLEYEEVNKMVKQWSYSSNDRDMRSLSIQQAASEELGVPLSDWQKERIERALDWSSSRRESLYPREKERRFVRAAYDYTQEILANAGYGPDDTIRMYRAIGRSGTGEAIKGSPQRGTTYKYHGNAMESWSLSRDAASPFGQYIFSADIPVRNIVASAVSGQGCFTEAEFLVAGSMGGEAHLTESGGW